MCRACAIEAAAPLKSKVGTFDAKYSFGLSNSESQEGDFEMKSIGIALAAALILGMASPSMAAKSAGLAAGGRTLAGPGTTNLAGSATETVYTHAATNTDGCGTVVNGSKASSVRLTLVGSPSSTSFIDVAAGGSGSLCKSQLIRMDLTCLGGDSCSAQWRVDDN